MTARRELSEIELRRRMIGCWLGKAVGGTLGMPYEGVRSPLNLGYYDPVPTEMLPNDDLDSQVIYACLLDRMAEPRVDRHVLTAAWRHVGMSPDEYGVVKRNLRLGLRAPATGSYDNAFTRGMGAAIRTEIWACLAPGDPDLAAKYAYEDACMDHAGEGIEAAIFLAALQSQAFVQRDRGALIACGLGRLPRTSELRRAIEDTMKWWSETGDWRSVQASLAERYLTDNFTDVVINLAYIILGWLAGKSFGESICIAVNCGQDTDCTGATLGATLGLLDPDAIEPRWLEPIGRQLVLSPSVVGVEPPATLDAFTDLVLDLRRRIAGRPPAVAQAVQTTDHLAIRVRWGELDEPVPRVDYRAAVTAAGRPAMVPGTWMRVPRERASARVRVVRYGLNVRESAANHLMVCSGGAVRAWWDGRLVIESSGGGEFVPAFHRCVPEACVRKLEVSAGEHELVIALEAGDSGGFEWLVGLSTDPAAPGCRDWIEDPFDRLGMRGGDGTAGGRS